MPFGRSLFMLVIKRVTAGVLLLLLASCSFIKDVPYSAEL